MINYENFKTLIERLQKISDSTRDLYQMFNIDLINYGDDYGKVIDILIKEAFTEEQAGWIEWFMWENDFGRGDLTATDEQGYKTAYDIESLYKLIKEL